MYLHVRITLNQLVISLPHEDGFSKINNSYIKSAYCIICDDNGVNAAEIWMILTSKTDMKIGSNRNIKKGEVYH